jgi:hypothetical protein
MVIEQMAEDVKRTLPTILARLSLEDLLAVEREEPFGAAVRAERYFGPKYLECMEIRDFS